MSLGQILSLAILTIFTENLVLVKFLGVDAFLRISKRPGAALGVGLTVTVVMGLASLCAWAVDTFILVPLGMEAYLRTVAFILVIAALVQLVRLLLKKVLPALYVALGSYLPLLTINCAVLGVILLNTQNGYGAPASALCGVFGGLGFTLAILLLASLRERLEFAECPGAFEGLPITLVTAGLLAMCFMGFSGLRLS